MTKARLLAPWVEHERRSAMYHVVSRVIHRQFLLKDAEKEQFVRCMRLYEAFCGVRVLSYCVMTNHFHILVEVPPKMDKELSDEALVKKLSILYSEEFVTQESARLRELSESTTVKGKKAYLELRAKYTRRMWDLGQFMKTLKQRFSTWYNARHGQSGTLWEARYKSVLVEDGHAARVMAAYIDLNPVRAGMVKDPKDYRWCSYGSAVAGGAQGKLSRFGLCRVMEERDNSVRRSESDSAYDGWLGYKSLTNVRWGEVAGRYRLILFEDGEERIDIDGKAKRRGINREAVEYEIKRGGELALSEVLRCKTRWFMDGGVVGGKEFVREVITGLRGVYLSETRKSKGSQVPDHRGKLWSMRQLD